MQRVDDSIDAQFASQTSELTSLQARLEAIEEEMRSSVIGGYQWWQERTERYDQMKREFVRKMEALDRARQPVYEAAMRPVWNRLNAAIEEFARRRGIAIVVNVAEAKRSGSLVYYSAVGRHRRVHSRVQ
jgi:Skp family chaperone for outer membrane proteins